eukprot:SAG31_NODE_24965_length_470_cov_192.905660_1_plen_24_part_10
MRKDARDKVELAFEHRHGEAIAEY